MAWVTVGEVVGYLGLTPDAGADTDYLAQVTAAANSWAGRRRQAAGYMTDDPAVSPGPDVSLGVVILAGTWYRRRGAPDGFAGWADTGEVAAVLPGGGMGDVYRLLGIGKPLAI